MNVSFINDNFKVWIFWSVFILTLLVFILTLLLGIVFGYLYEGTQIERDHGVSFECNEYTSNHLRRNGCQANITIPGSNITMQIKSNFDSIKVIS